MKEKIKWTWENPSQIFFPVYSSTNFLRCIEKKLVSNKEKIKNQEKYSFARVTRATLVLKYSLNWSKINCRFKKTALLYARIEITKKIKFEEPDACK